MLSKLDTIFLYFIHLCMCCWDCFCCSWANIRQTPSQSWLSSINSSYGQRSQGLVVALLALMLLVLSALVLMQFVFNFQLISSTLHLLVNCCDNTKGSQKLETGWGYSFSFYIIWRESKVSNNLYGHVAIIGRTVFPQQQKCVFEKWWFSTWRTLLSH